MNIERIRKKEREREREERRGANGGEGDDASKKVVRVQVELSIAAPPSSNLSQPFPDRIVFQKKRKISGL